MRNLAIAALAGLLLAGCAGPRPAPRPARAAQARPLPRLGFTIQAGAFAQVENASRLAEALQARGLDAVYYRASNGLYRVRFGDFKDREAARARGEALMATGTIQAFYIAAPDEPALARPAPGDEDALRANLVDTARSYQGVPYLWGGTTAKGFDCSGLTLAVYRLNGLELPRSSREQFEAGEAVALKRIRPGDLVFFAARARGEVTHVGLYIGDGVFIHAPGRGRAISRARLEEDWFRERFVGARSYL